MSFNILQLMSNQKLEDLKILQSNKKPANDSYEANDTPISPPSLPPRKAMLPATAPPSSPRQHSHGRCSLISPSSSPSCHDSMHFHALMQSTPRPPPPPPPPPGHMIRPPPPFFHNHDDLMMALELPFAPYGQPHAYQTWPGGYNMQLITQPSSRPWSTGPCDCFLDIKNSFITLFCDCFTFGQIAEIINEGQTSWWENALIYFVLEGTTVGVATSLYVALYRVKMRDRFSLNGTLLWDVLFSIVCTRLSLCQQYRQLDRLGFLVPLGWQANMENQRRIAMESMFIHHQFVPPLVEPGMHR